jgi:hypothetical protein
MPFQKTPESSDHQDLSCGMTQRVFAGPCSEVISCAGCTPESEYYFFAVLKCKTPELVN